MFDQQSPVTGLALYWYNPPRRQLSHIRLKNTQTLGSQCGALSLPPPVKVIRERARQIESEREHTSTTRTIHFRMNDVDGCICEIVTKLTGSSPGFRVAAIFPLILFILS